MRILIFDPIISGHHLEYLHHLYMMAVGQKEHEYFFVVHRDFEQRRALMTWPESNNISFDFLPSLREQTNNSIIEMLKASWRLCKLLSKYVKKYQANKIFTNNLISFVPFAPFFLRGVVTINGIIYHIYLYKEKELSRTQRLLNVFKYQVMARSQVFGTIMILNDPESAVVFNLKYKCDKFVGLPDPFVPIPTESTFNFREKYGIPQTAKVFVHFGGLAKRKGTLDIIQSLRLLNIEKRSSYWFVFAGVLKGDLREQFYEVYNELKDSCHIILKDEFCSYEFLASMCLGCDAILAPYHETDLSSGMFGYASQFGRTLIAPASGLVGKVLKKYQLGIGMESLDGSSLCEAYDYAAWSNHSVSNEYIIDNSVVMFQKIILNILFEGESLYDIYGNHSFNNSHNLQLINEKNN